MPYYLVRLQDGRDVSVASSSRSIIKFAQALKENGFVVYDDQLSTEGSPGVRIAFLHQIVEIKRSDVAAIDDAKAATRPRSIYPLKFRDRP
jgi:hypothetical protein